MPRMEFVADIHLHSRWSRATSRDLNPENLHKWSQLKGIGVVGTADFTHPEWLAELKEKLEPAEEGLFRLRPDLAKPVDGQVPPSCRGEVRFLLTVEISSIYKRGGRTRKVHNVVCLPGFDAVDDLNRRLSAIGNLGSDGRPILGLDSRDLLEICLEVDPRVLFIPAHIWTPHFAVLGASSGFDSLEECFDDLLPHIFAVETGLSSDPPMNSRLSALDRYAVVSNSDAHSPSRLGREATCFDTDLSYTGLFWRRCARATPPASPAPSSSIPRRGSTTTTATASAGSAGSRPRPGPPAVCARSAGASSPWGSCTGSRASPTAAIRRSRPWSGPSSTSSPSTR